MENIKAQLLASGARYIFDHDDAPNEEYAHFYFTGSYQGKDVIFDTVLYTLRLQHESELFEIADQRALQQFPVYKKLKKTDDVPELPDELEEEVGLYMAEVIAELEDDEAVKVKEHVDVDDGGDGDVGIDAGLHVPAITPAVIEKFIADFTTNSLKLDDTLYAFQTDVDEDE